uniref:Uncharacterized protein n=1 Tax=Poecilia mexicana TaxID=48701 RepID=A0A3B3YDZ1_9TELE
MLSSPGVPVEQVDLLGFGEALDGFQDDGEAQRREKDSVDQSPHHLRSDPSECVFLSRVGSFGKPHRDQSHNQRQNVRQHMEGVREHREGRGNAADHHLDDEELHPKNGNHGSYWLLGTV